MGCQTNIILKFSATHCHMVFRSQHIKCASFLFTICLISFLVFKTYIHCRDANKMQKAVKNNKKLFLSSDYLFLWTSWTSCGKPHWIKVRKFHMKLCKMKRRLTCMEGSIAIYYVWNVQIYIYLLCWISYCNFQNMQKYPMDYLYVLSL